jgi:hypothetical protein
MFRALLTVVFAGLVASAGFEIGGGRIGFAFTRFLFYVFGDLSLNNIMSVFLGCLAYVIFWISLSAAIYSLLRLSGEKISLTDASEATAFAAILPHSVTFLFALFSNYFVHLAAVIIFAILIPLTATPSALKKVTDASFFKRAMSSYVSFFAFFIVWTSFTAPLGVI